MQTITAHRERVGGLKNLIDTLKASHEKLFELRSESWHEQMDGEADRAERLEELHRQITALEAKIDRMRLELGLEPPKGPI